MSLSVNSEPDIANSQVLRKVFGFLDWKSKKMVREVCRFWKEELDDSGLNIKIDNGFSENVEFASKALAKKINVVNIESKYKRVQLKYPNGVISVKCIGKIEPLYFIKEILTGCENLTELHLTGSFLISQQIGNLKNVRNGSKIEMQNLKILRIEFGLKACQEYLSVNTPPPQGIIHHVLTFCNPTESAFLSMKQILDTNMTFLLSQIRSPKLNILYIFVDLMPLGIGGLSGSIASEYYEKYNFEWKNDAIAGFLEFHRKLTRIYLPNFQGHDCSSSGLTSSSMTGCSEKVKTLEITLTQPQAQIESGSQSFMEKLLLSQKSLKEIRFENRDWWEMSNLRWDVHYKPLNFRQVFVNNSSTLTYIYLNIRENTKELLTGYTFQYCYNLETFILEYLYFGTSKFENFNALPKSLKTIHIIAEVVVCCQPLDLHKFNRLENLTLWFISVNLESFTATISSIIMNALRSRRLNNLCLNFISNHLLLFRDKKLADAMVALAKPTDQVCMNGSLDPLEIIGPEYTYATLPSRMKDALFLTIEPNARTDLDLSYGRGSNQMSASDGKHVDVDQVVVRSTVYYNHNVRQSGVFGTLLWGIDWVSRRLFRNPALTDE